MRIVSANTPENFICVKCKLVTRNKPYRCDECDGQTFEKTLSYLTYPELELNIPIKFLPEELDNILCNCFSGGSNYWVSKVEVIDNDFKKAKFASEVISRNGKLIIVDDGETRTKRHELTKEKLLQGIQRYFSEYKTLDFDDLDGGSSDIILQYALFGEIKYS